MKTLNSFGKSKASLIAGIGVLLVAAVLILSVPFLTSAASSPVTVSATASYPYSINVTGTVTGATSGQEVSLQIGNATANTWPIRGLASTTSTGAFTAVFTGLSSLGLKNGTYTVEATYQQLISSPVQTGTNTFVWGSLPATSTTTTTTTTTTTSSSSVKTVNVTITSTSTTTTTKTVVSTVVSNVTVTVPTTVVSTTTVTGPATTVTVSGANVTSTLTVTGAASTVTTTLPASTVTSTTTKSSSTWEYATIGAIVVIVVLLAAVGMLALRRK